MAGHLTPPSSPIQTPQNSPTSSGVNHSPRDDDPRRIRRLRHTKSPVLVSPNYSIPQTSLYQYPSDYSLASIYNLQSTKGINSKGSGAEHPRMFTAVIPPLAAVPPTAPLPPTPPMQGNWEKLSTQEALNILEGSRKSRSQGAKEVVVGILKDTRAEKEAEKKTKGLRRMKGNVADAVSANRGKNTENVTVDIIPPDLSSDTGLPTPGPTPPSSAKRVTVPRQLHHPKPYKLPCRRLDFNRRNNSNNEPMDRADVREEEADDEGGIAIDYDDGVHGFRQEDRGLKPTTFAPGKHALLGSDIPIPDSPFVTGFAVTFEDKLRSDSPKEMYMESPTQYRDESGDEGVRLSSCRKTPEIITPKNRINSDKAILVDETNEAQLDGHGTAGIEDQQAQQSLVSTTDDEASKNVRNGPCTKLASHSSVTRGAGDPEKDKKLSNVDLCILSSSILKRRYNLESTEGNVKLGLGKLAEDKIIDDSQKKGEIQSSAITRTNQDNVLPTLTDKVKATPITSFAPPQLPRFNFIPATPLALMTPASVLEKQLGNNSFSLSEPNNPPIRPSLNSQPKKLRNSRLHPWWRPRNYVEDEYLAKLLEDTIFTPLPQGNEPKLSEYASPSPAPDSSPGTPRRELIEFGPLKVDKKRKVVGVGGVQIQWVGLSGWYDKLVGKKDGKATEKTVENLAEAETEKVNLKRKGWIEV
ncbi:hypothetical protein BDZ91DRAFT_765117 [Kalaharituber pfeilii]|nr:hypothetical protein BDZ91DRAFT_765117 [Kalaharituber pfeilii]